MHLQHPPGDILGCVPQFLFRFYPQIPGFLQHFSATIQGEAANPATMEPLLCQHLPEHPGDNLGAQIPLPA